jgi:hypothetical protein
MIMTRAQAEAAETQAVQQLVTLVDLYCEAVGQRKEFAACDPMDDMSKRLGAYGALLDKECNAFTAMQAQSDFVQDLRYDIRSGAFGESRACTCDKPEQCSYCAAYAEALSHG